MLSNHRVKCRSSCDVISPLCIGHHFKKKKKNVEDAIFFSSLHVSHQYSYTPGLPLRINWAFSFRINVSWHLFPAQSKELPHPGAIQASCCWILQLRISQEGAPLSGNRRFPFADWGNVCMSSRSSAATEAALHRPFICLAKMHTRNHLQKAAFPSCW